MATVIAMDIRLPESQEEHAERVKKINEITNNTDLFICTDKEFAQSLVSFANVKQVWLADSSVARGIAGIADHLHENSIQWWRLQNCWDGIQEYERSNGLEYAFIIKFRTDCNRFGCPKYNVEALSHVSDNTAFLSSDFHFGAGRKAFGHVASLYRRLEKEYWKRDTEYVHIDWALLSKSDISTGKFSWLNYPKAAMGDHPCFSPKCIAQNKQLLEWSRTHSKEDAAKCETVMGKPWYAQGFSSEKTLVLDLLRYGFIIKDFQRLADADTKQMKIR